MLDQERVQTRSFFMRFFVVLPELSHRPKLDTAAPTAERRQAHPRLRLGSRLLHLAQRIRRPRVARVQNRPAVRHGCRCSAESSSWP